MCAYASLNNTAAMCRAPPYASQTTRAQQAPQRGKQPNRGGTGDGSATPARTRPARSRTRSYAVLDLVTAAAAVADSTLARCFSMWVNMTYDPGGYTATSSTHSSE
jgi:hypothetical protein